jgi:hypothetical protein
LRHADGVRDAGFAEAGGACGAQQRRGLRVASALPWRDLSGFTAKASAALASRVRNGDADRGASLRVGTTPFVVAGTPIAWDAAALELGLEGAVAHDARSVSLAPDKLPATRTITASPPTTSSGFKKRISAAPDAPQHAPKLKA